jgi:hypothetical protein
MYGRTTPTTARIATPRRSPAYRHSIPVKKTYSTFSFKTLSTRYRLAVTAAGLGILSVIVGLKVIDTYSTAYDLFDTIGQSSSIRVDTAEQALQHIANVSTSVADFDNPISNDQTHQTALNTAYGNFTAFRTDLYTLHTDLDSDEQELFAKLESTVYNQFWPQIALAITAQQAGDTTAARNAFVKADGYLQNDITRILQQIETANFAAMKAAEQQAGTVIIEHAFLIGLILLLLAGGLTVFSFWLRFRVRRLLTLGVDAAMVIAWLLLAATLSQLLQLPEALHSMVEDAYYSVSASSRALAIADQGNRAESASLLDAANAKNWQQAFDNNTREVELRLCGVPNCLQTPFSIANTDTIAPTVLSMAKTISPAASASIGGIVPLVANVTYAGEAQTLETVRKAYLDYLAIDGQLRGLIAANQMTSAWVLDTGTQPGQSDEAFNRFTSAMEHERVINRAVFDSIWQAQQSALPGNRILYGVIGIAALIGLLIVGTVQRFREL